MARDGLRRQARRPARPKKSCRISPFWAITYTIFILLHFLFAVAALPALDRRPARQITANSAQANATVTEWRTVTAANASHVASRMRLSHISSSNAHATTVTEWRTVTAADRSHVASPNGTVSSDNFPFLKTHLSHRNVTGTMASAHLWNKTTKMVYEGAPTLAFNNVTRIPAHSWINATQISHTVTPVHPWVNTTSVLSKATSVISWSNETLTPLHAGLNITRTSASATSTHTAREENLTPTFSGIFLSKASPNATVSHAPKASNATLAQLQSMVNSTGSFHRIFPTLHPSLLRNTVASIASTASLPSPSSIAFKVFSATNRLLTDSISSSSLRSTNTPSVTSSRDQLKSSSTASTGSVFSSSTRPTTNLLVTSSESQLKSSTRSTNILSINSSGRQLASSSTASTDSSTMSFTSDTMSTSSAGLPTDSQLKSSSSDSEMPSTASEASTDTAAGSSTHRTRSTSNTSTGSEQGLSSTNYGTDSITSTMRAVFHSSDSSSTGFRTDSAKSAAETGSHSSKSLHRTDSASTTASTHKSTSRVSEPDSTTSTVSEGSHSEPEPALTSSKGLTRPTNASIIPWKSDTSFLQAIKSASVPTSVVENATFAVIPTPTSRLFTYTDPVVSSTHRNFLQEPRPTTSRVTFGPPPPPARKPNGPPVDADQIFKLALIIVPSTVAGIQSGIGIGMGLFQWFVKRHNGKVIDAIKRAQELSELGELSLERAGGGLHNPANTPVNLSEFLEEAKPEFLDILRAAADGDTTLTQWQVNQIREYLGFNILTPGGLEELAVYSTGSGIDTLAGDPSAPCLYLMSGGLCSDPSLYLDPGPYSTPPETPTGPGSDPGTPPGSEPGSPPNSPPESRPGTPSPPEMPPGDPQPPARPPRPDSPYPHSMPPYNALDNALSLEDPPSPEDDAAPNVPELNQANSNSSNTSAYNPNDPDHGVVFQPSEPQWSHDKSMKAAWNFPPLAQSLGDVGDEANVPIQIVPEQYKFLTLQGKILYLSFNARRIYETSVRYSNGHCAAVGPGNYPLGGSLELADKVVLDEAGNLVKLRGNTPDDVHDPKFQAEWDKVKSEIAGDVAREQRFYYGKPNVNPSSSNATNMTVTVEQVQQKADKLAEEAWERFEHQQEEHKKKQEEDQLRTWWDYHNPNIPFDYKKAKGVWDKAKEVDKKKWKDNWEIIKWRLHHPHGEPPPQPSPPPQTTPTHQLPKPHPETGPTHPLPKTRPNNPPALPKPHPKIAPGSKPQRRDIVEVF